MTNIDPNKRPTIDEILKRDPFIPFKQAMNKLVVKGQYKKNIKVTSTLSKGSDINDKKQ
jgi:hypothetical protein